MLDVEAIRDTLHGVRVAAPAPPAAVTNPRPGTAVGAPAHLVPGSRVLDTVTGQEGEVIAYGRAAVLVAAPAAPGR